MATSDYDLVSPPKNDRGRELWIQHAAGFILMEDVRRDALESLPITLSPGEREIARQAVDATLYGLMKVADGVTGVLQNETERVELRLVVRYSEVLPSGHTREIEKLDLFDGDGACMGIHRWLANDFGDDPVAVLGSQP